MKSIGSSHSQFLADIWEGAVESPHTSTYYDMIKEQLVGELENKGNTVYLI